jgi:DNA-binding CsgD family transcriptional regulator
MQMDEAGVIQVSRESSCLNRTLSSALPDMDDGTFQHLLDRVYGAAADPGLWPSVLSQLSDLTGSHGAVLVRQNEESGQGAGIRAEPNPEATQLYYGYFATRNVFLKADNARAALSSYRPSVLTDAHKVSKEELIRSEYYNDFMRRFDIHSVLMFRLAVVGMDTVILNLHRTKQRGDYDRPEVELGNALLPHLIRAFDVGQKVASSRTVTGAITAAQDRSPHGQFVVDDVGQLLHANAAGRAMLAATGSLRLVAGRLSATTPNLAGRLEGLIRRAGCADPAARTGGSMILPSPGHRTPLMVTVIPASSDRLSSVFAGGRSSIVCVTDPDARLSLSELTLRDLFGLTPAETRVAVALFEGDDPSAAAHRLNLSVATVRTHLAHIFDKTQAHSQVELTRLLARAMDGQADLGSPAH